MKLKYAKVQNQREDTMSRNKDVIIIGAGTAGLSALREVRKSTDNFLLINDGPYGTTCARVGCMPSKALIEAANAFHRRHAFEAFAIRGSEQLTIDVPAVLRRVRTLRDKFVAGVLETTAALGEKNLAGRARLNGPNRVIVNDQQFDARRIIIATGSRPIIPQPWTEFAERILTTDNLFEQQDLPHRLAVIGLGVIGVEIAQALSRLGLDVVAFDSGTQFAGLNDPQINAAFSQLLQQEFPCYTGSEAQVSATADGLLVKNQEHEVAVDKILVAIGRQPNLADLGLETLGIELDKRGMPPCDPTTMRIADLPVFLAGDANGQVPLLHEAADEGHIAGLNATRESCHCFTRRTPLAIVFCDPNVAMVGERFEDMDAHAMIIGEADFKGQGRARTAEKNKGLMRIYAEKSSGRLLGAEMCVPDAEHMAHLLALAIGQNMTVWGLLRIPFYHPVLEEGLRGALRQLARQLPEGDESDLATCGSFQCEALD